MLLCLSSGLVGGVGSRSESNRWREVLVNLAGDVALHAADDLALCSALGEAPFEVVASGLVVAHPDDGHDVESTVGGAVSAATEAVPAGGAGGAVTL